MKLDLKAQQNSSPVSVTCRRSLPGVSPYPNPRGLKMSLDSTLERTLVFVLLL